MRAPGFHADIPEADYHADRDSLSVSGAKILLDECPAIFRHRMENPVHRDVFDLGSAAHARVLGVGAPVTVIDADDWRSKAAREQRDAAREAGETPLLAKDFATVCAMADKLSEHTLAMRLLSNGAPEVSAYAVDEETGVTRRGRFDWLGESILTDYKTAANVNPRNLAGKYGTIRKFGYHRQAAWYTDLAADLGHPASAFAFIFQAKEPPYLVTVSTVPDAQLWQARDDNARALETFAACTASGIWPGYVPDDHFAEIDLEHQHFTPERPTA